jgi:prolyl-tRNA editing enzyme YbaK/EbsC (Cys-tRNA(Pro) deacylase)
VQVKSQTGFSIGGVSPIAHLNNLKILVDSSLSRFNNVFAAAGHPNCVFKITYLDLIKITNGTEKEITE